jgi:uncharacterized protein (TIRG00374 family)
MLKQWLMPVIKLGLASALIGWLIQSGRFDLQDLKKIGSPRVWLVGISLFFVVLSVNAKRWQVLLMYENIPLSFWQSLRLSLIGIFFNFFMPGGVGGDVIKASYLMREEKHKKWFIGWSIFVDRVFGLLALMLYSGLTGVLFSAQLSGALGQSMHSLSVMILCGLLGLVLFLILSPKKKIEALLKSHPLLDKVLHPLFYFFKRPRRVILPFVLSLISQGVVLSMGCYLVFYLNLTLPYWILFLIFPFGFLATIIPISPAGIGVGQAAFSFLFEKVAQNGEFGVLVITYFQAVQFLVGLLGGLIFVLYRKKEA